MAKKVVSRLKKDGPGHFIREWRKFRRVTLERLAARVEVTPSAIGQLERGEVNYTQPMLEAIAEALDCSPGALVSWPPEKDPGLVEVMRRATPEQAEAIKTMAHALVRKAG